MLGQVIGEEGFPDLIPEQRDGVLYPATVEGALRLRGYALTREALVRGLHDPNAQVRSMAADELAKQGEKEAVPAIREALLAEKEVGTRVLMANALAKLGVDAGTTELRSVCELDSASYHARLVAAMDLLSAGDATCRDQVSDMVRSMASLGSGAREDLLIYGLRLFVGRFAPTFGPKGAEVRETAATLLRDGRRGVRMAASDALAEHGDATSLEELQRAAAAETSDIVRGRILADIETLRGKVHSPAKVKE
jgi:HEAT repeat protein